MAALVWKTRNWSVVRAELCRVCSRLRPGQIQRNRAMIPFKYRLVTDEAKCGSMGRTRHLLRVYIGQETGSRGGHGSHGHIKAAGVHVHVCTWPMLLELPSLLLCADLVPFDGRLTPKRHPLQWLPRDSPRPCPSGSQALTLKSLL